MDNTARWEEQVYDGVLLRPRAMACVDLDRLGARLDRLSRATGRACLSRWPVVDADAALPQRRPRRPATPPASSGVLVALEVLRRVRDGLRRLPSQAPGGRP